MSFLRKLFGPKEVDSKLQPGAPRGEARLQPAKPGKVEAIPQPRPASDLPDPGLPEVAELKAKHDVGGLTRALDRAKDAAVRQAAASALGETGDRGVEALLAALKNGDVDMRKAAAVALGRLGRVDSVKSLLLALDADSRLGEVVVDALARMGAPSVDLLIKCLREPNLRQEFYRDASAALGKIGAVALEPLLAVLKDRHAGGREFAIAALAEIGGAAALNTIADSLGDPEYRIRDAAGAALKKLAWLPEGTHARVRYYVATEDAPALAGMGEAAVEPLITVLKQGFGKHTIAQALGAIGDPRAVEPLAAAFENVRERENTDKAIVAALVRIGGPGVDALIAELQKENLHTFPLIAEVAAGFGAPGVQALEKVLHKGLLQHREIAARQLRKAGWRPQTTELQATFLVAQEKWDECVKLGAAAIPALVDEVWQEPARNALVQIGEPAVGALVAALDIDQGTSNRFPKVSEALVRIGDSRAIPRLLFYLKNNHAYPHRKVAGEALIALGWRPGTQEDEMAYAAAIGIWQTCAAAHGDAATPVLVETLHVIGTHHSVINDRIAIVEALGTIAGPESAAALTRVMQSDPAELVRNAAQRALSPASKAAAPGKTAAASPPPPIEVAAKELRAVYARFPDGIVTGSPAAQQVRTIGQALYASGGHDLMLLVHSQFGASNFRMKRNLEMLWDGIGDWKG